MVIVSACLAGVNCRYDGASSPLEEVVEMVRAGRAVPLCPEQLGGLPTPRLPSEIHGGDGHGVLEGKARVINAAGADVTAGYLRGAEEALKIARLLSADKAILKDKSPACGAGLICRRGRPVSGFGVLAAMLVENGFAVVSSGDL